MSEDVLKVPKVTPLEFMRRSLKDKQFVVLDTRNVSYLRQNMARSVQVCFHISLGLMANGSTYVWK